MLTPNDPNARKGSDLHSDDRRYVLSAYVHRYTGQQRPQWAARSPDCPVQFADDADWLAHTWFAVRADGRLDHRHKACYSRPTWPNNPELRKVAA